MKVLRQADQARILGCSRWTIRRIIETDSSYPAQREISRGISGVFEHELQSWLESRPVAVLKPRGRWAK
jgi:predicted DNA-binding transcriptional regulator AlpA